MKDVLSVFTFTIAVFFLVALFSTLKPATVTAAVGGTGKLDRCSLTASSTPGCQTNGLADPPLFARVCRPQREEQVFNLLEKLLCRWITNPDVA